MVRYIIRKMCIGGDETSVIPEKELSSTLATLLRESYQAAVSSELTSAKFLGSDSSQVLQCVYTEVEKGAEEVEVLLVPIVSGG